MLVPEPCGLGPKSSEAIEQGVLGLETMPEMASGTLGHDLGILRQLLSFLALPKVLNFFSQQLPAWVFCASCPHGKFSEVLKGAHPT